MYPYRSRSSEEAQTHLFGSLDLSFQHTYSRLRGCSASQVVRPLAVSLTVVLPLCGAMPLPSMSALAQAPQAAPKTGVGTKTVGAKSIGATRVGANGVEKGSAGATPAAASDPPSPPAPAPVPTPAALPDRTSAEPTAFPESQAKTPPTLEETRLTLSKWIETQQIISKERNDWQQGKEILQGRIELVGKEVSQLGERITQSEAAVSESHKKRDELSVQNEQLKEVGAQLAAAVTEMESQVQKLSKMAPEGVATRLTPLLQRIPTNAAKTRISTAERFQNVLGILNELNKANSEITIAYEIRQLSDGSSSEVQVVYVGLAQAYFLSPRGEAGIGKQSENGWQWRSANDQAGAILTALEIIQGKHPPAFVALPITIQ